MRLNFKFIDYIFLILIIGIVVIISFVDTKYIFYCYGFIAIIISSAVIHIIRSNELLDKNRFEILKKQMFDFQTRMTEYNDNIRFEFQLAKLEKSSILEEIVSLMRNIDLLYEDNENKIYKSKQQQDENYSCLSQYLDKISVQQTNLIELLEKELIELKEDHYSHNDKFFKNIEKSENRRNEKISLIADGFDETLKELKKELTELKEDHYSHNDKFFKNIEKSENRRNEKISLIANGFDETLKELKKELIELREDHYTHNDKFFKNIEKSENRRNEKISLIANGFDETLKELKKELTELKEGHHSHNDKFFKNIEKSENRQNERISLIADGFGEILKELKKNWLDFKEIIKDKASVSEHKLISYLDVKHTIIRKSIKEQANVLYSQIEAYYKIESILRNVLHPLPPFRGWSISPDIGLFLIELVIKRKSSLILTLGSGVSDVILGYALKKIGKGKLISLEHKHEFYGESILTIKKHQLSKFVEVLYCPLKDFNYREKDWEWYDFDLNILGQKIDLLFIDGPPGNLQKHSRYPAVPFLKEFIDDNTIIVLDDGMRKEEKEIVEMWLEDLDNFVSIYKPHEKGTFIILNKKI